MRQVLIRKGNLFLDNVPSPLVEPGYILVEVAYSLISTGTELLSVQSSGESLVKKALGQPEKVKKLWNFIREQGVEKAVDKVRGKLEEVSPTGYSCSGIVVQVGEGVTDIRSGDRVACAGAGVANHAEIVLVPRNLVVTVPDACGLKNAASMTLGAIAMQGVRRADPRLGEIVAVIGLGLLGQISVQLLKVAGCQVIGFDKDPRRVAMARQLGADYSFVSSDVDVSIEVRHLTDDHGVDATIITAASQSDTIVQQAMEITRKKGRVVVVGAVGLGLNRSPFYEKEIDFLISCSYGPGRYDELYEKKGQDYPYAYTRWTENRNMKEYLRLVGEGKVQLGAILEREYDLSQAPLAYRELQAAPEKPLGVILHYPSADESDRTHKMETKVVLHSRQINDKVRIAVIGAGGFAKGMHLPNLRKLPNLYHIRAIVSNTGSNAKIAAQQFNADYASTNYQDVLDDPDLDAVLICTRHHLHAQQAMQAAQAGKAILLEKPMALTKEELDKLTEVLQETKVPFMIGYNRRFSPAIRRTKEIIDSRKNPLMIHYRMNAGYLPPEHWIQTKEGGGRIIGEACHIFDLLQYLIGTPMKELNAFALASKSEHILGSDNVSVTIKYEDGSVATLLYTALGSPDFGKEYMELYSDGKVLVLDDYRSLRVYGSSEKGWMASAQDKGHLEELRVFASCTLKKQSNDYPIALEQLFETTKISIVVSNLLTRASGPENESN
jgi:predicted dehydrogenase/threonine dehydrogenase-like Zn-dependent dehydrogenase